MRNKLIEEIYREYYTALFLYAFSLCKNKQDAQDLVSETIIKAYLSYRKTSGSMKNWLLIVLKNLFISEYRRRKKIVDYPVEIIEDSYDALEYYIKEENKRWLYRKIYDLKEPERSVMLLTIQFSLQDKDIAKYLNISEENVRTLRYRTKNKLKAMARKEGYLE